MTVSTTQLALEISPAFQTSYRTGLINALAFSTHVKEQLRREPNHASPFTWTSSHHLDVPSDIVVEVGGTSFALHKLPLISRCGLLNLLVVGEGADETTRVQLDGMPGGPEGFELAAKFCYGARLEISNHNVALLRCVAEFLDMSEEHGEGNLVSQTESYLERLGTKSFRDIVATLRSCESLIPMAEDLKIVSRCVEWVATKAVSEQAAQDWDQHGIVSLHFLEHSPISHHMEWWVEDLSVLHISFFQKVLSAMREKSVCSESVEVALVFYTQKYLVDLPSKRRLGLSDSSMQGSKTKPFGSTAAMEHEQRILVETIVSLLPREKQVASLSYLIGLLRTACMLETTLACRLDLEKRIGAQLHKATLDDLLIPSFGKLDGETLFDVNIVHRLIASFVEQQGEGDGDGEGEGAENGEYSADVMFGEADPEAASHSPMSKLVKVAKLLDAYLAEVAPDANLNFSKFIALAQLIPDYARPLDDDLYRAIDVFLKAHSTLTDVERKKVCKLLDFQKLSQEACTHAAQNERLPVQAVVQVLYLEQLRIRNVMAGAYRLPSEAAATAVGAELSSNESLHQKISNGASILSVSPKDHYASVRRENRELKLEVARMRMRLSDLEKDHLHMKLDMERSHPANMHGTLHRHGFLHAFSKSISKLNPFNHHKLSNPHHPHPHKSHSQPEPHRRPSSSTSSSQASSFENHPHNGRRNRHSLS